MTEPEARIALFSRRLVEQKVWQASQYEFEDVIAEIDDVQMVMPTPLHAEAVNGFARHALNRLGRPFGRARRSLMGAPNHMVDAELFFAVFAVPHEIGAMPFLRAQVDRSIKRVAFIVEMYATDLPSTADYLRQLRGFDHIFVFTRDVLSAVREITGVPTSFLATGIDALLFAPTVVAPRRSVDVASYGRRLTETHRALLDSAASIHYSYDTVRGPFEVSDYRDHRAALASLLQRSRYAVVYKNNDEPSRLARTGGEETLTNRFFETTAAGAVLLGTSPQSQDFSDAFGWTDSLITIPAPAPGIVEIVAELDEDPVRISASSASGIQAGLEQHDWSYRWSHILDAVGIKEHERQAPRTRKLHARSAELRNRDNDIDSTQATTRN